MNLEFILIVRWIDKLFLNGNLELNPIVEAMSKLQSGVIALCVMDFIGEQSENYRTFLPSLTFLTYNTHKIHQCIKLGPKNRSIDFSIICTLHLARTLDTKASLSLRIRSSVTDYVPGVIFRRSFDTASRYRGLSVKLRKSIYSQSNTPITQVPNICPALL